MSGILPSNGVPPQATEGAITNGSYVAGCAPLFYPPRCNPRLDPFAQNTLISEIINLLGRLGRAYDCNVNDNLSDVMLSLAGGQLTYGTSAGTANARTLTLSPVFSQLGLLPGMKVEFRSHVTNTGAMTINVDGLGVKPIVTASGNPMESGDIATGDIVPLIYDGTSWIAFSKVTVVVPPAPPAIGVGQVWVDVTSSRATGTTYRNTTGKPIMISVTYGDDFQIYVSADGDDFVLVGATQDGATISAIVPNNHYYRSNSSNSLAAWAELR